MTKKAMMITLALLPMVGFANCTQSSIELSNAYATTVPQDDETLNAYITVRNRDTVPHTISEISSATNAPRSVMLQAYAANSRDDDILLGNQEEIVIPANNGVYVLRPGHTHIVLGGYKDRPNPGDTIDLTFTFADGCMETILGIPVQDAGEE